MEEALLQTCQAMAQCDLVPVQIPKAYPIKDIVLEEPQEGEIVPGDVDKSDEEY